MIICIGPTGGGKTLLLKRLQSRNDIQPESYADVPHTVPTVGTNIVQLAEGPDSKNKRVTVQEIGGAMSSIYDRYYADCDGIMFVIDAVNISKIGDACLLLLDLIGHEAVREMKPVLILMNKIDVHCKISAEEMCHLIMINDIIRENPRQPIEVIEGSSLTGRNLDSVFNWIFSVSKQ